MSDKPVFVVTPIYGYARSEVRYVPQKDGWIACESRVLRYARDNFLLDVGEWEPLSRIRLY
jgi:hypothetical protein